MPRRNAFNSWEPTGDNPPPSPVDMISAPEKKPRDRTWEKDNPTCSYIVPRPLWEAAYQVRDDILSIAQYDERGVPRDDRTTVNAVAAALMDWALQRVENERALLDLAPNPHARGHLTIAWVEENTWDSLPLQLPAPKRKSKTGKEKDFVLSYRWSENIDQRIRKLAGHGSAPSPKKKSPFTHAIPIGEVVIGLLRLAIADYKVRRFKMKKVQATVSQTVSGWEVLRSK